MKDQNKQAVKKAKQEIVEAADLCGHELMTNTDEIEILFSAKYAGTPEREALVAKLSAMLSSQQDSSSQ